MKVTVASKSRHWEMWAALRAANIPIISSWIDWNRDDTHPDDDEWAAHVVACIDDVVRSDVLILYCKADERQFGSLLECGAALSDANKQIFLVAPSFEWAFLRNHPRVRSFDTLEQAITAIVAMMQGERARQQKEAAIYARRWSAPA
jgi:hypothetical protein